MRGNLYRLPLPDRALGQHSLYGPPFVHCASPPHHLAGRDPALAGAAYSLLLVRPSDDCNLAPGVVPKPVLQPERHNP